MPRRSHVYRRPGSPHWWYDFTIHGRRFRGSSRSDRKETAEIIAAKLRADALLERVTGRKPRTTIDAAFGRYWLEHAHGLPNAPTIEYQARELVAGLGAAMGLDALTNGDVATYVAKRRGAVVQKRKARLSNASVNRELTLLRAVLNMARDRWGFEVAAIDWKAQWLREPAIREVYLTPEQAQRVIAAAAPHLRPAIELSLLTGLRLSNVFGLDWIQVDLGAREIRTFVKSHDPGGKPLDIPLSTPALVLLANLAAPDKRKGPVFKYKGRAMHRPDTGWKRALTRAGLPTTIRWHDLRHTAGSWMVQAGVPLDLVQKILGHANIQTTQRYAHRKPDARHQAVETLGSQLLGHNGGPPLDAEPAATEPEQKKNRL